MRDLTSHGVVSNPRFPDWKSVIPVFFHLYTYFLPLLFSVTPQLNTTGSQGKVALYSAYYKNEQRCGSTRKKKSYTILRTSPSVHHCLCLHHPTDENGLQAPPPQDGHGPY
jgi:hypothetical protein